jgi:murein DD-endopeptidase MepM/ murein hydrolase activator NlpD
MTRHRPASRGVLLVLLIAFFGVTAGAFAAPAGKVPRLVFPVIGEHQLTNSFGDPRGDRSHAGEDIMAPRKATVVAVEAGTVKFHTTSARAGCMLYLDGKSGTEYLYIHLNNDVTAKNDNRGKCVPGTAYWPGLESGDEVEAGQPIGFNGDSGDANAAGPHLHFEVHPNGGGAVAPYKHLLKADHLLFAAPVGSRFSLALNGTIESVGATSVTLTVDNLRFWPGSMKLGKVVKPLTVSLPPSALFERSTDVVGGANDTNLLRVGLRVVVWTEPGDVTEEARRGDAGALIAKRIVLSK